MKKRTIFKNSITTAAIAIAMLSGHTLAADSVTIQENSAGFCEVDGTVATIATGYTGTGYADTDWGLSKGINWAINGDSGTYEIKYRHANGSGRNLPCVLSINGTDETTTWFPDTGG